MKKSYLFLIAAMMMAVVTGASAQDDEKKFGIHVGLNMSNVSISGGDLGGHSPSWTLGYLGGINYDAPIAGPVYIFSAIDLVQKGFKIKDEASHHSTTLTYAPLFGQFTLHAGVKLDAGFGKIIAHAGPYVAYGFAGKATSKFTYDGETETESEDIYGEDGVYKHLDYGLGLAAGVELGSIVVQLGYDHGFANLIDNDGEDFSVKSKSLYLTVGYKF
ncbi:hypothetical protein AGMMS49574_28470 [Bacteroidia bacterium]|nr:hypothetical protein AGMMS49574_28470 [Bacteroidia bacterium]